MSLVVSAVSGSRKSGVERPPEERVDPALDVEEEEQHGVEPVEHAAARVRRRQPEARAAARLLVRRLTPAWSSARV